LTFASRISRERPPEMVRTSARSSRWCTQQHEAPEYKQRVQGGACAQVEKRGAKDGCLCSLSSTKSSADGGGLRRLQREISVAWRHRRFGSGRGKGEDDQGNKGG
jgi:hypothetical protein